MRDELLMEVGQQVIQSEILNRVDWDHVAIVVDLKPGVTSNNGFAYNGDKARPVAIREFSFSESVERLQKALVQPNKEPFIQMLIQIRRSDYKMHTDFEYEDSARWKIAPSTMSRMKEVLRPTW